MTLYLPVTLTILPGTSLIVLVLATLTILLGTSLIVSV
jgi:hypothetical protein